MIEAVKFNLANLLNFEGRDSRSTFWFYVLFLAIVYFAAAMVFYAVVGGGLFASLMQQARVGGTVDDAAVQAGIGHWMSQVVTSAVWFSVIASFVSALLLAASFTRRLHDSDKPGWLAAVFIAIYLLSVAMMIGMVGDYAGMFEKMDFSDPVATQQLIAANQRNYATRGLIGWIPMIALIVFGVWPSSDGDNRYGVEPEHL